MADPGTATATSPLDQLIQANGGQSAPQSSSSGLSPLEQLLQQPAPNDPQQSGQVSNDVGNTVIVPKAGESFTDTMKRAANQGGKTTQAQIDAEMATAPSKVAQTVIAAPVIGAAGVTAPVAASASRVALMNYLAAQSPQLFGHEAVAETLKKYALQGLVRAGYGATFAAGAELLHSVWNEVFGKKK